MTQTLGKLVADFETQLAVKMAVGATTGTLQSNLDRDGNAIPNGRHFFTIDRDNSSKEYIVATVSGVDMTGIQTVTRQGSASSGVVREHRVGANVIISDFAHIKRINDLLDGTTSFDSGTPLGYDGAPSITTGNQLATKTYADSGDALSVHLAGTETLTGTKTFTSTARPKYDTHPTFSADEELIDKKYADDLAIAGSPDSSTTVKGISKLDTAPASAANPIAVGTNRVVSTSSGASDSGKIPSLNALGDLSAFVPMSIIDITPFNSSPKQFSSDSAGTVLMGTASTIDLVQSDYIYQKRTFTSDWASAAESASFVRLGSYVYALLRDASSNYRVYRYDRTNLSAGGTLMTIATQALSTSGGTSLRMASNGTDFFFNFKGGNSANDYVVSRYTLSGTTLTYAADITCGSTSGTMTAFSVDSSTNIYGMYNVDTTIRKFNSSGTLQYTTPQYVGNQILGYISGNHYISESTPARFTKIYLS